MAREHAPRCEAKTKRSRACKSAQRATSDEEDGMSAGECPSECPSECASVASDDGDDPADWCRCRCRRCGRCTRWGCVYAGCARDGVELVAVLVLFLWIVHLWLYHRAQAEQVAAQTDG